MSGTNGHASPLAVPSDVTITEADAPKRCFKCEKPVGTFDEFVFSGVRLCEPCYRETVEASEAAEQPAPKPKRSRKKHIPAAPPGGVPSGEVCWQAVHKAGEHQPRIISAQTWFSARAQAMALFGCGPREVEVRRA